jgi:NADH-quinone oxidoreductase subunit E
VTKEKRMTITEDSLTAELKAYMDERKGKENPDSYLIDILHKAQGLYGYLSREVMDFIAVEMNIPTSHIWGVATFYHYFNLKPVGEYVVSVCMGTACYVKGAGDVLKAIKEELGIEVGETTRDGVFTLDEARCLGACGLAPVIMVDGKIHGDLTPARTVELLNEYRKKSGKNKK